MGSLLWIRLHQREAGSPAEGEGTTAFPRFCLTSQNSSRGAFYDSLAATAGIEEAVG